MSDKININLPVGREINMAIDSLYETTQGTLKAIGAYAQIEKREIKGIVDGVISIQEKFAYIEDSDKLKDVDILTSLYLSAYPKTDMKNDKAFNRFYACYRSVKTYHYGKSSKRNGKSGASKSIKRPDVISFLIGLGKADYNSLIKEVKNKRS